jgi:hypothetical protein
MSVSEEEKSFKALSKEWFMSQCFFPVKSYLAQLIAFSVSFPSKCFLLYCNMCCQGIFTEGEASLQLTSSLR